MKSREAPVRRPRAATGPRSQGSGRRISVFFVGAGAAARSLAHALHGRRGVRVVGLWARNERKAALAGRSLGIPAHSGTPPRAAFDADVLWIAVSDDALEGVATNWAQGVRRQKTRLRVVLHASGVHDRRVLDAFARLGLPTGSVHPLQSLADPARAAQTLRKAAFAVEGSRAAVTYGRRLVRALRGTPVHIREGQKALYHAAAAMTSNGTVGIVAAALSLLESAGVPRGRRLPMLLPLLQGTVHNLERLGPRRALTGPVARGDKQTLRLHRRALAQGAPSLVALYDALVRVERAALLRPE